MQLSSCGTGALLLLGMWDFPGTGGFLTTGLPGKSRPEHFDTEFERVESHGRM